ncbi:hypothetical protein H0H92_002546 [Tricholoma furcatifolium]|nr:hypothetical protein H0H92_002546 [Tricholoma furcatifolium]
MEHAQRLKRARSSSSRKKGKLKRPRKAEDEPETPQFDPNASILVPKSKEVKDQERREKLREELAAQADSKWNSKKKRRLEKYIDKQLKKEERLVLFEKLAQTQAQIPSSLHLQTSSSLGTGKASTNQERHDQQEDKEIRRALDGRLGKRKRGNDTYAVIDVNDEASQDSEGEMLDRDDDEDEAPTPKKAKESPTEIQSAPRTVEITTASLAPVPPAIGSALKKNADGTVAAPTIRQKSKTKTTFARWKDRRTRATPVEEAASDTSFDSSDSEYDSSEEEGDEVEDGSTASRSDSSDESGEEDQSPVVEDEPPKPRKRLGFKDWAVKQLNTAKGYDQPTSKEDAVDEAHPPSPAVKKRKIDPSKPVEMRGPLGRDLKLPDTAFAQHLQKQGASASAAKVKAVTVNRPPDVEEARILLPIVTEEQPIMEAVLLNPVVIICGETGSGKTTQVPQFLYEAGFGTPGSENPGMIGITQPRRVAAMSMAARVSHELSLTTSRVSYQIRYDATVSSSTSIKFMTDGVLLRELATDFLLTKYSVIIIDEAHERSINTDILIGVLSRVLKLREAMWKEGKEGAKPLRLIIMSATLRVSDFAENRTLFPSPPPVINVAARQHPVTIHFSRRTAPDYVTEAIKKTTKIHTRLPPGGILVFLTGQNEITGVCRKLEAKFGAKAIEARRKRRSLATTSVVDAEAQIGTVGPAHADIEAEDFDLGEAGSNDLALDVDDGIADDDPDALDSEGEDDLNKELGLEEEGSDVPMHVVPLYSLLPSEKQMRVFEPPPPGSRLVVVSTNVAETSLTIPNIRYVVDCGRAKERRYDISNGIQAFVVNWISKASAAQRAGRAGRTGPGHCYRLYSSALFEHHFDQFSLPEINRMPIEGVVLQMKSMHIDAVVNFPFPTPPERSALLSAEKVLTHLGALSPPGILTAKSSLTGGQITDLGKTMSLFPLSPRFSRMLVNGQQHGCLPYVIAIVSALSVGDPFLHDEGLVVEDDQDDSSDEDDVSHLTSAAVKAKEARRLRRKAFFESQHTHASLGQYTSDVFRILSVVGAYEYAGGGQTFCAEHFVRPKAMEEIHKLRAQISNIVQMNFPGIDAGFTPKLSPPSALQLKVLRQLLTAGFIDQVAVRKDRLDPSSANAQYATSKGIPYRALGIAEDVFLHPSSVLANVSPPEYIVFNEVVRTSRAWLKGLTVINPAWLSNFGKPALCTFSKPTKNMAGIMMTIPRFGPDGWELPPVKADILQK